MTMMLSVNRSGDHITGHLAGVSYGVSFSEDKYIQMKNLEKKANLASTMEDLTAIIEEFKPFTKEDYGQILESKSPYVFKNPVTGKFHLKIGNVVSRAVIPSLLANKLIEAVDKNLEVDPIIKCWSHFLKNPNYTEDKARLFAYYLEQKTVDSKLRDEFLKAGIEPTIATERATVLQTPITTEGLISTYKVSTEIEHKYRKTADGQDVEKVQRYDFDVDDVTGLKTYQIPQFVEDRIFQPAVMGTSGDPFMCYPVTESNNKENTYGHIIRVGHVHELKDWSQVNCNDYTSCVKGLHCGNLDYIRGYQSEGTITHYTFVNPMDIGAIVSDNTGALRVRRYYTYGSFAGVTRSLYHSAPFAAMTESEYKVLVSEAVEKERTTIEALIAESKAKLAEMEALQ